MRQKARVRLHFLFLRRQFRHPDRVLFRFLVSSSGPPRSSCASITRIPMQRLTTSCLSLGNIYAASRHQGRFALFRSSKSQACGSSARTRRCGAQNFGEPRWKCGLLGPPGFEKGEKEQIPFQLQAHKPTCMLMQNLWVGCSTPLFSPPPMVAPFSTVHDLSGTRSEEHEVFGVTE